MMKTLRLILLAVIVALTAACSGSHGTMPDTSQPSADSVRSRMLGEMRSLRRLDLASMAVTKMSVIDDYPPQGHGVAATIGRVTDALKIGSRKAVYSYNTYLTACIDLSELAAADVAVDTAARTVSITLPRPSVRVKGRDATLRVEHYRVTGLRSSIGAAERAGIKERMNAAVMAEIESDPEFTLRLVDTACRKAEAYINALVAPQGYTAVVTFRKDIARYD